MRNIGRWYVQFWTPKNKSDITKVAPGKRVAVKRGASIGLRRRGGGLVRVSVVVDDLGGQHKGQNKKGGEGGKRTW